ncbi:MAG: DUF2752 domain-containing protein [Acidimicrobiales bacterium]
MTAVSVPMLVGWRDRVAPMAGLGIGAVAVAAMGDDEGVILCPFRRCTGGYCPLCGTTRSAASLARFDLAAAWARHPLIVLMVVQFAVVLALRATGRIVPAGVQNRLLAMKAGLALVVWALRLWAGHIPAPVALQLPF